jgi:hypothetical protein
MKGCFPLIGLVEGRDYLQKKTYICGQFVAKESEIVDVQ